MTYFKTKSQFFIVDGLYKIRRKIEIAFKIIWESIQIYPL